MKIPTISLDKKLIFSILLILTAGIIVYLNSFDGVFVYDDERHILLNPKIRSLWPPWESMFSELNMTRPLVGLSLAINYALTQYDISSYHYFNLGIHLLAALALFGVIRRLCLTRSMPEWCQQYALPIATTTALLWVVHPVHVQAVTYITQRFQSVMGLFYFATTYAAIRFFQNTEQKRWIFITIFFAICGMTSKEDMVAAPFVILILDRLFFSDSLKQVWQKHRWIYFGFILSFAMLLTLNHFAPSRGFAGFGGSFLIPYNYALTQMRVLVMYLAMAFLPLNPTFDYRLPTVSDPLDVLPQIALIFTLLALTIWLLCRRNKFSFFGVWFFSALALTSTILPIADSICEYRLYVPLAALMALVSFGIWKLVSLKKIPATLACIIFIIPISFYGYKTYEENENFHSQMKLWEVITQKRPGNARAWNNYGITLERDGNINKAYEMYKKSFAVDPGYIGAVHSLARIEFHKQNYSQSLYYLDIALRLSPHFSSPYMIAGKIYSIQNKNAEAEEFFKKALERDPYEVETLTHYGILLLKTNRPKEAIPYFEIALRYEGRNPEHYFNLGTAYAVLERPLEAKENFLIALQFNPRHAGAINNLDVIRRKYNIH